MCDNQYMMGDLEASNMRLHEDRDRWRNLCLSLSEVVKSENRIPPSSSVSVHKHRDEWPQLWEVIDRICQEK